MEIQFENRSFCFTGKFSSSIKGDLEKETRSKGAVTVKNVGPTLDYLIVGGLGNPSWKHGSYGRKIELARLYNRVIISENDFLEQLHKAERKKDGELSRQLLVIRSKLYIEDLKLVDDRNIVHILGDLSSQYAFNIRLEKKYSSEYKFFVEEEIGDYVKYELRLVRALDKEESDEVFIHEVKETLSSLEGLSRSKFTSYYVKEGTSTYSRLFNELQKNRKSA